jgi:hypothetical protein
LALSGSRAAQNGHMAQAHGTMPDAAIKPDFHANCNVVS